MNMKKRIRKPVEAPRNPFDAAKIIHKAMKNLYGEDRSRAVRWALEMDGYSHPIRIQGNARYPEAA